MDKIVSALVAIAVVPVVLVAYILLVEAVVRRLPRRSGARVRPLLWVFPAVTLLFVFLIYPTIATILFSLMDRNSERWRPPGRRRGSSIASTTMRGGS